MIFLKGLRMKFMMALIYALAAALLMGLLGVYFYFTILQRQTLNQDDETIANIALLLFVNAVLVFSMILIWLENMPNDTQSGLLEKYITEIRNEEKFQAQITNDMQPVMQRLNQISHSLELTNKTLNMGLERLSTRIDEVENMSLDNIIKNENNPQEEQPELSDIFNDKLAKTLSGLEIMQDSSLYSKQPTKHNDIDLDTFLNNIKK